jgi:hypothetical protein
MRARTESDIDAMPARKMRQGLKFVRLMMVVSSLAPLFVLWAIRGMQPVPDHYLIKICAGLVAFPTGALLYRIWIARWRGDRRSVTVTSAEDHRDHLFVYLFAVLIPLFDANLGRPRDSIATVVALVFIVFLFWHLELHYANLFFAMAGFRVFTIRAERGEASIVLLTKRTSVAPGAVIHALRLSDTLLLEIG